ncbi:uncharacterized mitochondrial protein AtMg00860-like [Rutidosis leptorrhynchoides]|uniref:uncharacterized mitochondrial protein AtMg00860-like n=1 Tax=Rutidosis leptorrhynchoides TaxID=125765 RepID=UPI003A99B101
MLSERKMILATTQIDFLGMTINNSQYHLQPHVAKKLLEFPDMLSTTKDIQQFLGIVNYMSPFIKNLSHLTKPLYDMLKKNPPPWNFQQTKAVQQLKRLTDNLPPLQIPSNGKRILQTDASDEHWGAVLLEEINGNRNICGYQSGHFKPSETHYHSTFKEILAVKNGIKSTKDVHPEQWLLFKVEMSQLNGLPHTFIDSTSFRQADHPLSQSPATALDAFVKNTIRE